MENESDDDNFDLGNGFIAKKAQNTTYSSSKRKRINHVYDRLDDHERAINALRDTTIKQDAHLSAQDEAISDRQIKKSTQGTGKSFCHII